MAYSARKYWTLSGGALALGLAGMTLVFWLHRNHTDPVSIGMLRGVLGLTVVGITMRAISYRDEVQRQLQQKRWFFGSFMGLAAMLPIVVSLQTHRAWLDAAVQFFFRHAPMPALYFSLGIMIPVMFQCVSVLILKLVEKLSQGPQS